MDWVSLFLWSVGTDNRGNKWGGFKDIVQKLAASKVARVCGLVVSIFPVGVASEWRIFAFAWRSEVFLLGHQFAQKVWFLLAAEPLGAIQLCCDVVPRC